MGCQVESESSMMPPPDDPELCWPQGAASYSRFVQRVRRRYPSELNDLAPGLPRRDDVTTLITLLQSQGRTLASALRVARHVVIERLAVLDVEQARPMSDITLAMTELAEATLDLALTQALREQDQLLGVPRNANGQRIDFWIVGMGKLGARELNVSSDIDLIYLYEEEGQLEDRENPGVSAHEYFSRLAHRLYALIGETTDDGQVFRVDLALRPNGQSGPAALSLSMLEEYLHVQGREWERFAWLKSRVVAPQESVLNGRALALRTLITPFVYRRYLDYSVFEALRQLHRKVREEARRRVAGRPERANDVKLSRGGIREIEFIVQLLLLVRGGQYPEIRTRSTLKGLEKLVAAGLMKPANAQRLAQSYIFLRELEHCIQYLDDQHTHQLPTLDADLEWMASSLSPPLASGCALLQRFCETREFVATEFDALLHEGNSPQLDEGMKPRCNPCRPLAPLDSEQALESLPPEIARRIQTWFDQGRFKMLRDDSKQRLTQLMMRSVQAITSGMCQLSAVLSFIDWLEPLLRREAYIALLVERPAVHQRLLRLLGLARWPLRYLLRHPGVIDELADERILHRRFNGAEYHDELAQRLQAWQRAGQDNEEALLDTLRRAHHAEVFRTLVRDVEGHITVEQVADDLSALADATLACTLRWSWSNFKNAHRDAPCFAIIAYGKLGSKELGYGSDLDLVFLIDDADEPNVDHATEVYSAFVRKFVHWLTLRTSVGELFDIDTSLRPNGNSGLLVSTMVRYEAYQSGRGSNTAWTWEHQALSRARICVGPPSMVARFEAVRRSVLSARRDPYLLRFEIQAMSQKIRAAHRVHQENFDVKHSVGGMMDAEFAVQYLVLAHSGSHPELLDNVGNIALLQRAEAVGLLPDGLGHAAAKAYRDLRRIQHRARLDEKPTQVNPAQVTTQREAITAVWNVVFDDAPQAFKALEK